MWTKGNIVRRTEIPPDLRTGIIRRLTHAYETILAVNRDTQELMCWEEILSQILYNTQISVSLQVLNKAFTSRIVAVPAAGNRPVQIITPNKELRGYIILNPSQTTTSSSTNVTMFASALRTVGAPGPTYTSGAINVEGVGTARFFLDISAITGATTIEVELQTLDRLSGNWAAAQTGIFGGPFVPVPPQTFYANVGELGIDAQARLVVTLAAGTDLTFSIGAELKPQLAGTISGPTIFLGDQDVTTTNGYRLLGGTQEKWWLKDNATLWAISQAGGINVQVFDLQ